MSLSPKSETSLFFCCFRSNNCTARKVNTGYLGGGQWGGRGGSGQAEISGTAFPTGKQVGLHISWVGPSLTFQETKAPSLMEFGGAARARLRTGVP